MNIGKAIGIAFLVIAIVAIGLLSTKIYNPSWNPFKPSPEKIIQKAGENLKNIKSFNSKITGSLEGETQKLAFVIDYNYSGKDSEKTKMEGSTEVEFSTEGITMNGEVDFITKEKQFFLKINTFPAVLSPYLQMFGLSSDSIKDEWIAFSTSSTESTIEDQNIENIEKEITKKLDKLFIIKKEYKDEEVNGNDCYHYLVELDNEKAKEVIKDIMKEVSSNSQLNTTELNQTFDQMKGLSGEIWIGSKDYNIYKLKTDSEIENATSSNINSLSLEITFSDFNKDFEINVPENFITLKELMNQGSSMFQQQLENSQVPSQQYQY